MIDILYIIDIVMSTITPNRYDRHRDDENTLAINIAESVMLKMSYKV